MAGFQRRARWLNALFPASQAPTVTDPAVRSDDVSLVAPYDGGGFGFPNASELCTRTPIPAAAAQGGAIIITTGPDEIFRLMGADVAVIAGSRPRVWLIVIDNAGAGDAVALTQAFGSPPIGEVDSFPRLLGQVIGPSCTLNGQWINGDVLTQVTFGAYGFRAPLGTSFQV